MPEPPNSGRFETNSTPLNGAGKESGSHGSVPGAYAGRLHADAGEFLGIFILFGSPGSGKGTQAKLLSSRLEIPHISTGDMLRSQVELKTEIGTDVADLLSSGTLAPDDLVNWMVRMRIQQPDCRKGFILDGYPRTTNQAQALESFLVDRQDGIVVIHLQVDYNKIITRLTGRRHCPECGTIYNLQTKAPKRDSVCDRDGSALIWRDDDREEVIRQRLAGYEEKTAPVLDYLQSNGYRFVVEDGSAGTPSEIADRLSAHIAAIG